MGVGEEGRLRSIQRTLRLVRDLLDGKRHDRHTAAKRLGIKEANAYRQLEAIAEAIPGMEWSDTRPQRLRFDAAMVGGSPDRQSAVAACFGASLSGLFSGTRYQDDFRRALEFLVKRTRRKSEFQSLERKFYFVTRGGEQALPQKAEILERITSALLQTHMVRITYERFEAKREKLRVQPLTLAIYEHQLYLIGREDGKQPHPYRLSRIAEAEVMTETFSYPEKAEYDPDVAFHAAFGIFLNQEGAIETITIRLSARWATYARSHRWHRSQSLSWEGKQPVVTVSCRVCPEVFAWILGFGDEAEVLAPERVRHEVLRRLRAAVSKYGARR